MGSEQKKEGMRKMGKVDNNEGNKSVGEKKRKQKKGKKERK